MESAMTLTVKDSVFRAFGGMGETDVEEWAAAWPGQATYLTCQLWFTLRVRSIFLGCAEG